MNMIFYIAAAFFVPAIVALFLWNRSSTLAADNNRLQRENHTLNTDFRLAREHSIRLESEKASFERQVEQQKQDLKKIEETLIGKFENLSNKIFDEKSEKFKKQSQESLGHLLTPLKEKINEFQKKVDDSFGNQAKEQFSLKEQIKNIVEVHEKMTLQTENLTKALKTDNKAQGNWGEIILEKILEDSGLQKDIDYTLQGAGLGLAHPETGRLQKPDVIVNLPENKHIIIDSKVSLTDYEKFCSEPDETLRAIHLDQFLQAVKRQVKELEQRRYQDTEQLGTPEIVLMFMPIEGAFMLALQHDRSLHQFAWSKKVAIVCPSTLFATLKTISSLWMLAKQNQQAGEIARQGGALYDKIAGFMDDMTDLGKKLQTAENTYRGAMNKLITGKGNILSRTEKLRELGAKTSKMLPIDPIEVDMEEILEEAEDEKEKKRA